MKVIKFTRSDGTEAVIKSNPVKLKFIKKDLPFFNIKSISLWKTLDALFLHPELTNEEKLYCIYLLKLVDKKTGYAFPHQDSLAKQFHVSKWKIINWNNSLNMKDIISWKHTFRGNRYYFTEFYSEKN